MITTKEKTTNVTYKIVLEKDKREKGERRVSERAGDDWKQVLRTIGIRDGEL